MWLWQLYNVVLEQHQDEYAAEKTHRYGLSSANQHIEGWWSFLKCSNSSWWLSFFKDMSESGLLNLGDTFHLECLWFCFTKVIQADLEKVTYHWKNHHIRHSRHDSLRDARCLVLFTCVFRSYCLSHTCNSSSSRWNGPVLWTSTTYRIICRIFWISYGKQDCPTNVKEALICSNILFTNNNLDPMLNIMN